jgi:hypothetical protein
MEAKKESVFDFYLLSFCLLAPLAPGLQAGMFLVKKFFSEGLAGGLYTLIFSETLPPKAFQRKAIS